MNDTMKLNSDNEIFYSKILLFGEYGIIKGSKGLALPFKQFCGRMSFRRGHKDQTLKDFVKSLKRSSILNRELALDALESDLEAGLFFSSDIPQGMGLGSSGALCAALFSRYSNNFVRTKLNDSDLSFIQEILSIMESYFHGTSSGLDPLISYINEPLVITSGNKVKRVNIPTLSDFGSLYLLDTKTNRKTSPLVHQFLKDCSDEKYFSEIEKYMNLTNIIIDNILEFKTSEFVERFKEISKLQYLHFEKMIPKDIKGLWLCGLETRQFFIKLCGAGGGGYYLVHNKGGEFPLEHELIKVI